MDDYIIYSNLKDPQLEGLFGSEIKIKRNSVIQIRGASNGAKTKLFKDLLYLESKKRLLNCLSSQQKLFLQNDSENIVEKIFPVVPVWNIERKNPMRDSRTNLIDLIGISNLLQNYFFHEGKFLCPSCKKEYAPTNRISEILRKMSKSDEDIVYLEPKLSQEGIGENYSNEKFVRRLKVKNLQKIDNALSEIFSSSNQVLLSLNGHSEILTKSSSTTLECKSCGDKFDKSDFHKGFLSNLNSYGACRACNGYGATLEYTADALITNYTASIKDSIRIFGRSSYSRQLKKFEHDLASFGITLQDKISKKPELIKKILMDGHKSFVGFKEIFKELDEYKYKPAVRIFMRSVQSEVTCTFCDGAKLNPEIAKRICIASNRQTSLDEFINLKIKDALLLLRDSKRSVYLDDFISGLELMDSFGLGDMKINARARDYTESQFQRAFIIKHYLLGLTDTMVLLDNVFYGLEEGTQKWVLEIIKRINERKNTIVVLEEKKFEHENFVQLETSLIDSSTSGNNWLNLKFVKDVKNDLEIDKINVISFRDEQVLKDFKYKKLNPHYFNIHKKLLFEEKIYSSIPFQESISEIYCIDSQASSVTSRSTIGTSTGILNYFRNYWAKLDPSMDLGFTASDFSSNTTNGMCRDCEGRGFRETDLLYFGTIQEKCQSCNGFKHKIEAQNILDTETGFSFSDVLQLRLDDLITFYPDCVSGNALLAEYLDCLGLEFLRIGDELNSLSRGELSRFKLAIDLNEARTQSLFLLENLTLELSQEEVQKIKHFIQLYLLNNHYVLVSDPLIST